MNPSEGLESRENSLERQLQAKWAAEAKQIEARDAMLTTERSIVQEMLGMPGRMISGSKRLYAEQHPTHVVVFNANLCLQAGKIWFGDLDITKERTKLQRLAKQLGAQVFVLREMDARFESELHPRLHAAVEVIDP